MIQSESLHSSFLPYHSTAVGVDLRASAFARFLYTIGCGTHLFIDVAAAGGQFWNCVNFTVHSKNIEFTVFGCRCTVPLSAQRVCAMPVGRARGKDKE